MDWILYKDGKYINTIVADEVFIKSYCSENGYTYELQIVSEPHNTLEEISTEDRLSAVELAILTMMGGNELV